MDILSPAQKRLWPELRNAQHLGFTLYAGTAIALRLRHRDSVDFNFFSEKPLDREAIKVAFEFVEQSTTRKENENTWVLEVSYADAQRSCMQVAFFGTLGFGRIGGPDFTGDGVLQVASVDELMATKVEGVLQRAQAKDYRDVAVMVNAGVGLARGLASACQFFLA